MESNIQVAAFAAWLHELCTALAPVVPEPFKGFIACSAAQAKAMLLPSEFCAKY